MASATITLRSTPIGDLPGLEPHHHMFIVYTLTQDDGKTSEYFFRAGPSGEPSNSDLATEMAGGASGQVTANPTAGEDRPFGNVITTQGAYVPGTIDWDPQAFSQTVISGSQSEIEPYFLALMDQMETIDKAGYRYNPVNSNSNTAAFSALENVGLNPQLPIGVDGEPIFAPGYDTEFKTPLQELTEFMATASDDVVDWINTNYSDLEKAADELIDTLKPIKDAGAAEFEQAANMDAVRNANLPEADNPIVLPQPAKIEGIDREDFYLNSSLMQAALREEDAPLPAGWAHFERDPLATNDGVRVVAFVNADENRAIIAFGSDLENEDALRQRLGSDYQGQFRDYLEARMYSDEVRDALREQGIDNIGLVGHQYGAVIAETYAREFNLPATTFESPGSDKYAEALGLGENDRADITLVQPLSFDPDLVGGHVSDHIYEIEREDEAEVRGLDAVVENLHPDNKAALVAAQFEDRDYSERAEHETSNDMLGSIMQQEDLVADDPTIALS